MDPLTITSTVISLSARCITSARALYELREKYKDASMTITAIYSESNVIATSLAHIQGLCIKNPEALESTLQERPELEATFDQALTGCVLVYSVLDDEVQRLYTGIEREGMAGALGRIMLLWKEEAMKDVLMQIRGQQTALSLLIQALQMSSLHEIRTLLQNNIGIMQTSAQRLGQFRRANPRVRAPSSILEIANDDTRSLYSVNSTATSTNFMFDDLVVNSAAYRRAMNLSQSTANLAPLQEQPEGSSDADTVVDAAASQNALKYDIPLQFRQRLPHTLQSSLCVWLDGIIAVHSQKAVEIEVEELVKNQKELREKYVKVKKFYFEMAEQNKQEVKDREMLTAEYSRVVAEKAETDHEKDFLQEQAQQHTTFFHENEAKRKVLIESHRKELKLKDDRIQELEDLYTKEKTSSAELRKSNTTWLNDGKAKELEISLLKKEHAAAVANQQACEEQLAKVAAESEIKENELQRYKGFESIIEQLRLLSPAPPAPASPGGASTRASAEVLSQSPIS